MTKDSRNKALTPKQRVLKRWPKAQAFLIAGPEWVIYNGVGLNLPLNLGSSTLQLAWAVAAKHPTVLRVK